MAELKLGGSDEADELTRLRSEKAAGEFWRGVFSDEDCEGTTREKIERELHDFHFMMEQVPKVYMHVTGHLLSKCNYYAEGVIAAADDFTTRLVDEAVQDAIQDFEAA